MSVTSLHATEAGNPDTVGGVIGLQPIVKNDESIVISATGVKV